MKRINKAMADANYCDLCDELADLEAELEEVEEALRN